MSNYGDDGQLTADLEKSAYAQGIPHGIDPHARGVRQANALVSSFKQKNYWGFSFLEGCASSFRSLPLDDEKPRILTTTVPSGVSDLQRHLTNGTKVAIETHFNCAFRFLPDGRFQVGASSRTFEVYDQERSEKPKQRRKAKR